MEKYDVKFKKKFGQNFLKDINIVKRIVDVSGIDSNSLVIEVGPGGGVMTRELASRAKNVLAYEIDTDLEDELFKRLEGFDNVDVLFQDFLTSDLVNDVANYEYNKLYFVSNVPYYITTPILLKIIESGLDFNKIVIMVQKEVGDRFTTLPGNREYGSITVLLNYFYDVKKEFFVSRKQFVPEPNVDSLIVSFSEKKDKLELNDFKFFERILRDSFQFKRKTLKNNLKNYDLKKVEEVLKEYDYDLTVRAENLSVEIFVKISNALRK
ncbi:MAG: ribosomal RNA small subunit methyltransferase A [Bacilli bacterium]|nr:ribosomal RNA small subunit methyltransferase A [Bacilli bacterium]